MIDHDHHSVIQILVTLDQTFINKDKKWLPRRYDLELLDVR